MSNHKGMDKENVVDTDNGYYLALKKTEKP
jgi:hypothetical protein